ncbi:hypothetical protein AWH56_002390 [Anaerobacillus isosaccharinicus]|uniref:Uncharacterized protein n=1 Tax=Anaerobacillus isosaccharinicus TaxID=1532552 RepID=A0A1S2MES8_9BACI|nr:hypothetical protein [Anaerobacillus isosaccharinicus]MBA5585106.1 hypothetical protein [Anaerobacillus isosaccharinicus]QOY36551.1 hypothetical protein AWH56_002390 [Anaerobacillus isosaccharinicus]
MHRRQKYFVTLNPQEVGIGEIRDDSQLIQYEVEVTEQELHEIQKFIEKYSDELYDFSDIILHPFNERDVNVDNQQSLGNLEELYRLVYKFGTEKTKRDLESIQRENNNLT